MYSIVEEGRRRRRRRRRRRMRSEVEVNGVKVSSLLCVTW